MLQYVKPHDEREKEASVILYDMIDHVTYISIFDKRFVKYNMFMLVYHHLLYLFITFMYY